MNPIHVSATVGSLNGWCLGYILHRHRDTASRAYDLFDAVALLSFELIDEAIQATK